MTFALIVSAISLNAQGSFGSIRFEPDNRTFFKQAREEFGLFPAIIFTSDRLMRGGRIGSAGINMAGGNVLFTPGCYPARLSAFGIKLFSLGNVTDNDVADIEEIGNDVYKRLFFHDDKLCGVLLIGAVGEAMKYQKLYLEQAEKSKVLS